MVKTKKAKIIKSVEIFVKPESGNKSYFMYILVGLLLILGVYIWSVSNKVKKPEVKKEGTNSGTQVQNQQVGQPTDIAKSELKITDEDPSLGAKSAKVTIVLFDDFLCPFCAALSGENKSMTESMKSRFGNDWEPAMTNIIKNYVNTGKVRLVWKDAPYHGDQAVQVHAAARCANEQGKFWDFHNLVFSQYGNTQGEYNKENLKKLGLELKLNTDKYNMCVENDKYMQAMRDAITYAQGVGANGTPASFINGKLVSGAQPYTEFKKVIDEELKK
jgi:protein-disulfide isomerase